MDIFNLPSKSRVDAQFVNIFLKSGALRNTALIGFDMFGFNTFPKGYKLE